MRKLRVLLLVDYRLIPPIDKFIKPPTDEELETELWRTEYYVWQGLIRAGHEVKIVPLQGDLTVIKKAQEDFSAHVAFNLLEEFNYNSNHDHGVVSYLEMIELPHTGCNPKGLMLAKDKSLSKKVLTHHKIKTPLFAVAKMGKKFKRPTEMKFPLFVKSLTHEGSVGISQNSVVHDEKSLEERVTFIHEKIPSDAIVESFIEGRDIYVSILGHDNLKVLPSLELRYENITPGMYEIASDKAKWNPEFRKRHGVDVHFTEFSKELNEKIEKTGKKIYRALCLSGYARLDLRITAEQELYFIEANPNPDIARVDEFAQSAQKAGISYEELLTRMMLQAITHKDEIVVD